MIKTLKSFISIKYSIFSFLFLGSFLFLLLSVHQSLNIFSFSMFKKLCYGIPALFCVRTFGMIINQIIDYSFDKKNPRTCYRILPSQILSRRLASLYAILSVALFLFLSYCLSYRCFIKGCLSSLCIIVYPYIKRFHACCHFILGLIYFFAIITLGEALLGKVDLFCFIYAISIALFISANDIVYGILDIDFDKQQGLFSFPSVLGEGFSIKTVYFCYGVSLFLLVIMGLIANFSNVYYILLGFFFLILFYLCVRLRATLIFSPKRFCSWEKAFFFSNILISLSLFSLFTILYVSQLR